MLKLPLFTLFCVTLYVTQLTGQLLFRHKRTSRHVHWAAAKEYSTPYQSAFWRPWLVSQPVHHRVWSGWYLMTPRALQTGQSKIFAFDLGEEVDCMGLRDKMIALSLPETWVSTTLNVKPQILQKNQSHPIPKKSLKISALPTLVKLVCLLYFLSTSRAYRNGLLLIHGME